MEGGGTDLSVIRFGETKLSSGIIPVKIVFITGFPLILGDNLR